MDLTTIPTADLIAELAKRDGIYVYTIAEDEEYRISKSGIVDGQKNTEVLELYEGSAKIITVVD